MNILLLGAVCFALLPQFREVRVDDRLPLEAETKIRDHIYNGELIIESNYQQLPPTRSISIPSSMQHAFDKYPIQVGTLLCSIIDGASPSHSYKAYRYFDALLGTPGNERGLLTNYEDYDHVFNKDEGLSRRGFYSKYARKQLAVLEKKKQR